MPTDAAPAARWKRQGLLVKPPQGHPRWATHAQAPTVLPLSPRCWRVYFGGRDGANCSRIFYADLDPGNDFRVLHVHEQPLLECGEPGQFDVHGMGPATVLRVGDQVWLYYSGIAQRRDVPYQIAVGLAISDDEGRSFRRAAPGPVMSAGRHDPCFVSTPCVWREGDRFRAVYMSATRWIRVGTGWECCYDLRCAESRNGMDWTLRPDAAIGLVGDEAGLARPWIIADNSALRMWFCHRGLQRFREAGGETYRMQAAYSQDGLAWQRDEADLCWSNPPAPGDWDGWMQAYPCVLPMGDELVMFYNGNDFGRGGFGWARAERTPSTHR